MASGHNDPKLLYAINGVKAFHISNGKEESLTPAGPQTLSLLMVPTSSPFSDGVETPAEDFYLHLHLPPELDLPLPATTQIYHQPPTSYLIPRWDLGPDSGAFTRIEFPDTGSRKGLQEDVDTFETILAQCTAFLERAPPPKTTSSSKSKAAAAAAAYPYDDPSCCRRWPPPYNPADYQPGQGYAPGAHSSSNSGGRIVLIDEEDGSVIGELTENYQVNEELGVRPGTKGKFGGHSAELDSHGMLDPVEITLPADNSQAIIVQPMSQEYREMVMHPSYKKSFLVSNASKASRLIVTSSDLVTKGLQTSADSFTKKTKPTNEPVTFTPAAHDRVRRINQFSTKAAGLSATTVGAVGKVAQNLGATLARKKDGSGRGYDKDGNPIEGYKPGLLNRSLMAFNTVADGIDQAGRNLLTGTSSSVSQMVEHRWGAEAGEVSRNIGGGFKNVGLVYIDVTGVSRRAILKSVAKGMVVGKVKGGGQIIVGGGDGGAIVYPEDAKNRRDDQSDTASLYTAYEGNGKQPAGQRS
ncbi:spermatogenesis-associated protein 20 [Colletotrichum spaethianum]|uniref:Spermatogenesis-associated protein 20 n=1 Tax=Colletotrichum spaethianum TaxID=700344 RepID=A0AA37LJA6_9PEZI|nr:spermatogenesis-associated protein 20 [Colletotrichum spaethianum]GKT47324.1 spermatogenesis-associated protein 20 [Colletotrichum spaethianum]